jgi:hypothetical protein
MSRVLQQQRHVDEGLLNLSLWRSGTCVGTAQLLPADVAKLVGGLTDGLAEIPEQSATEAPGAGDVRPFHDLELRLAQLEAKAGRSAPRRVLSDAVCAFRLALVSRGLRALVRGL